MAGEFEARVSGLPDLRAALLGIAPKLRKRALRTALAAGARVVRDTAKRATPVLAAPVRNKAGQVIRKPGTVRDAISVRTSKRDRKSGDVGVFVNVKPALKAIIKGGVVLRAKQKGANSPNDPYYWQWLEFGRAGRAGSAAVSRVQRIKRGGVVLVQGVRAKKAQRAVAPMPAYGFLQKGAAAIAQALEVFKAKIGPQITRLNGGKSVEL